MNLTLNAKLYDLVKWSSIIFIPALNGLWLTLATVWGWPLREEVSATIIGLNVFTGVLTGVSSSQYYKEQSK